MRGCFGLSGMAWTRPGTTSDMSIQVLHYEFLGPVAISEWEPPMEKVVYVVLARERDQFNLAYVDVCESTDSRSFFVSNASFKCWLEMAGSEQYLYVAILPMFESSPTERRLVMDRIVSLTKPPCN